MITISPFSVAFFVGLQLLAGAGAFSPKSHRFGSKPTPSSHNANTPSPRSESTFLSFQWPYSGASIGSSPTSPSVDDVLARKDTAMSAAKDPYNASGNRRQFPDKSMSNIYEQNQIWKQQKLYEDQDFFKKLGSGHKPDYMWIGRCNFDWFAWWCENQSSIM
jgi:hypothetical protein